MSAQNEKPGAVVLDVEATSQASLIKKPIKVSGAPPPPKDVYEEQSSVEKDLLINEVDAPVPRPTWIKTAIYFAVATPLLLLPALLIAIFCQKPTYFGLTPTKPFRGGVFSLSLLSGIFTGFYLGTLTLVALMPWGLHKMESRLNYRILGSTSRSLFKHFLMIRRSVARVLAIFPTWILSQWWVVLPGWAPQLFTAAMVVFFFCLFKDIAIQQVAIRYHTTYHEKRINMNNLALKCMKILRKHYLPSYNVRKFFTSGGQQQRSTSVDFEEEALVDEFHHDTQTISSAKVEEMSSALFSEISAQLKKDELEADDLYPLLGKPDADAFFKYLDTDGNGDLTRKEFVTGISYVYADRDLLAKTLAESDDVIHRLDSFVTNIVYAMAFMVCMSVFNVSHQAILAITANFAIVFHFFFNDIFTEAFQSIVFVFITHPFDTGDAILVDGRYYIVRKIGLWYSSFYGAGRRLVYRRNNELSHAVISNIRRSGPMSEEFTTTVTSQTTAQQMLSLEERMSKFMKANPRDYEGITYCKNVRLSNAEAVVFSMEYRHKSNHADNAIKHRRNVLFQNFFKESLKVLDIKLASYSYDLPFDPVPV